MKRTCHPIKSSFWKKRKILPFAIRHDYEDVDNDGWWWFSPGVRSKGSKRNESSHLIKMHFQYYQNQDFFGAYRNESFKFLTPHHHHHHSSSLPYRLISLAVMAKVSQYKILIGCLHPLYQLKLNIYLKITKFTAHAWGHLLRVEQLSSSFSLSSRGSHLRLLPILSQWVCYLAKLKLSLTLQFQFQLFHLLCPFGTWKLIN